MSEEITFRPAKITLKKFVAFHAAKTDIERVMVITGKSEKQVRAMELQTVDMIILAFDKVSQMTAGEHTVLKWIGLRRLGFIPDLTSMSLAEYVDIDDYRNSIWPKSGKVFYKHLPLLMATLYRPVKTRWPFGKYYRIQGYDSDSTKYYMDAIERLPMSVVNGALLFFSTLQNRLLENSHDFLVTEAKRTVQELQTH